MEIFPLLDKKKKGTIQFNDNHFEINTFDFQSSWKFKEGINPRLIKLKHSGMH